VVIILYSDYNVRCRHSLHRSKNWLHLAEMTQWLAQTTVKKINQSFNGCIPLYVSLMIYFVVFILY